MLLKNLFFRFYHSDLILDINMFVWTIQWITISFILISLLHYLYIFFIDTLTVPKNRHYTHEKTSENCTKDISPVANDMQDELKQFLDNISNKETTALNTPLGDYNKF